MAKITLNNIGTLEDNSSLAKLNENFQTIVDEFDNVVSRDGTAPSTMVSDLDMNSNQILNLPDATTDQEPLTYGQFNVYYADILSKAAQVTSDAASVASLYDQFDDRYLGSKTAAPTLDNDGNALITGAIYWNSITSNLYFWNGSSWESPVEDALAILDDFDDRYLGAKATDPVVDNDGDPLNEGDLYWNTVSKTLKVYNGSSWSAVATFDQSLNTTDNVTFANITADQVQFTGGTGTQGTVSWNTDEETLDLIQNGATLQLGQESQIHCRNNTGSLISEGTPVMATGTLGASGRITIAPMDSTDPANAKYFIGLATEDIANGTDGKITSFGKVRNIDTTDTSIFTGTIVDGDVLWLDPANAGKLTNTEPSSDTDLSMPCAFVVHAASNGTLFVRVTPINEHQFQHYDADLTTIAAANNGSTLAGINQGLATTDSPTFAGLTVDTNTLYVDATNNRVGIGTTSPSAPLDVVGNAEINGNINVFNTPGAAINVTPGGTGAARIELGTGRTQDGAAFIDFISDSVTYTDYGVRFIRLAGTNALSEFQHRGTEGLRFKVVDAGYVSFVTDDVERMRITATGNVGIGTTNPNANAILDVTSTTKAFMPPRMTEAQRDAIASPAAGMVIYNTTTNVLNFHNGTAWGAV